MIKANDILNTINEEMFNLYERKFDHEQHKEANRVFGAIHNLFGKISNSVYKAGNISDSLFPKYFVMDRKGRWVFNALDALPKTDKRNKKYHDAFKKIFLVFYPQTSARAGAFGANKKTGIAVIELAYNPKDFMGKPIGRFQENLWTFLEREKTTFVHEFTHLVDNLRYSSTKIGKKSSTHKLNTSGFDAYINTPEEFNAFFIELTNFLYTNIITLAKEDPDLADMFLSSYKEFEQSMIGDKKKKEIMKSFTPEYRKRFKKRLYTVYDELKDMYLKKKGKLSEIYLPSKGKHVSRATNFVKSRRQKTNWARHRFKIQAGINSYHRRNGYHGIRERRLNVINKLKKRLNQVKFGIRNQEK
jgi:hypothetical protein